MWGRGEGGWGGYFRRCSTSSINMIRSKVNRCEQIFEKRKIIETREVRGRKRYVYVCMYVCARERGERERGREREKADCRDARRASSETSDQRGKATLPSSVTATSLSIGFYSALNYLLSHCIVNLRFSCPKLGCSNSDGKVRRNSRGRCLTK